MAGSKVGTLHESEKVVQVEIRLEAMVAGSHDPKALEKRGVPCEDIQVRFPIPEAWIYLFREDRHWGVGSVHARIRKPGKVKVGNRNEQDEDHVPL